MSLETVTAYNNAWLLHSNENKLLFLLSLSPEKSPQGQSHSFSRIIIRLSFYVLADNGMQSRMQEGSGNEN